MDKTNSSAKWVFDPNHSELTFKVKHMMIANVKGEFKNFSIEVSGNDIFNSSLTVNIDASSIYTNNDQRDIHLKSPDFFDADNHKQLTFTSTSFNKKDDEIYELNGKLTIKGIEKEVFNSQFYIFYQHNKSISG